MTVETQDQVLRLCLKQNLSETDIASLRRLSERDWADVVMQCVWHGVGPILYTRLLPARTAANVPATALAGLWRMHLLTGAYNARRFHELSIVLAALKVEGIPAILLKGAALAQAVYPSIALRPMQDLDLVVRAQDLWRTDTVLARLGYLSSDGGALLVSRRHALWIQHIEYEKGDVSLEIHPQIAELAKLDPWASAVPLSVDAAKGLMLCPEDLFLHQCLHASHHALRPQHVKHAGLKLIWLCDIAEILRRYKGSLRWDYIADVAKDHKLDGALRQVIELVNEWSDERTPVEFIRRLRDCGTRIPLDALHSPVQRGTAGRLPTTPDPGRNAESTWRWRDVVRIRSFRGNFVRPPSLSDNLCHFLRCMFPCKEFMVHHYPTASPWYVSYGIRIMRGVRKVIAGRHVGGKTQRLR